MPEQKTKRRCKPNPDRTGIYMDVLHDIVQDLNDSARLQRIFGVPVSRALVLIADGNDLRIEDGGRVPLTEEQVEVFLGVLDDVIRANSV